MTAPRPRGLSEDATEFVGAFRQDVAIDVDVDDAWARFEEAVEPTSARRRVPLSPLLWLGGAAAVAAAVTLIWVMGSGSSMHGVAPEPGQQAPDRARADAEEVAPSRSSSQKQAPQPQGVREPVDAVPHEVKQALPGAASPRPSDGQTPTRRRATKPEPVPQASRLSEELRLLDAMRAASKAGQHAEALRKVGEHAAAFPSGSSFAAERELAKVRALCGLGRFKQVRAAKAGFAKSHPSSHLVALVRDACPEAAKEIQKTDHDR